MQIQVINNDKLEIIINMDDLKKNNSNWNSFMSNSFEFHNFLLDILNNVNNTKNFSLKNCKLKVDTYAIPSKKQFILIITKIPIVIKLNKKFKNSTYYTAKFNNFNSLCNFCLSVSIKNNSALYFYDKCYYLRIKIIHLCDFKKFFFNLKEFADDISPDFLINENADLIIKNNAIEVCKELI